MIALFIGNDKSRAKPKRDAMYKKKQNMELQYESDEGKPESLAVHVYFLISDH